MKFFNKNKFCLIVSLYNEKDPDRIDELLGCLKINLQNELIKEIHLFYDTSKDDVNNFLYKKLLSFKKLIINKINRRPTFEELFIYSNSTLPGSKIIISNADIYFNDTLDLINNYSLEGRFLVLTRWEKNENKQFGLFYDRWYHLPNFLSADAWIFESPIIIDFYCEYKIGTMFCDSFLNTQLFKTDLEIINPCYDIQAFHIQKGISKSEKFFKKEMQHVKNEIIEMEYIRNDRKNPLSGVIWSRVNDMGQKLNSEYRRRPFSIIIDVTGLELKELERIVPQLKHIFDKSNKAVWLLDKFFSSNKYHLIRYYNDAIINYLSEYYKSNICIVPDKDFSMEEVLKERHDVFITSNLMGLFLDINRFLTN